MFGPILCLYKIETLLDQVSSVCGLTNRLDQIHAKLTLNHWTNQEMVSCFVRVHLGIVSIKVSQRQALANFTADHPSLEIKLEKDVELRIYEVERKPWVLKFGGFGMENYVGVGIVIISPKGIKTTLSFNLAFKCTNNQAEYEALVIGLEILLELGEQEVHIIGDSQLVLG